MPIIDNDSDKIGSENLSGDNRKSLFVDTEITTDEAAASLADTQITLDAKKYVNYSSNAKKEALFTAVEAKDFAAVRALIKAGVDVNATDRFEQTPIQLAVYRDQFETIIALARAGANLGQKNKMGESLLRIAMGGIPKKNAILALVKAGIDINAKDENGKTPIQSAMDKGRLGYDSVIALIEAGVDVNVKNKDGKTPLQWAMIDIGATFNVPIEFIARLLELGADVNVKDGGGRSLLRCVLDSDRKRRPNLYEKYFTMLLKVKADVNLSDDSGKTPLHIAVKIGDKDSVDSLIKAGADVNARDSDGRTALHDAASLGMTNTLAPLLRAGANIETKDNTGKTAVQIARELQNADVISILTNEMKDDSLTLKERIKRYAPLIAKREEAIWGQSIQASVVTSYAKCKRIELVLLVIIVCLFVLRFHPIWPGAAIILWLLVFAFRRVTCSNIDVERKGLEKCNSEVEMINPQLSWFDNAIANMTESEKNKLLDYAKAEARLQEIAIQKEKDRRRGEELTEQCRKESICPKCRKEWALSKRKEIIRETSEFRTEIKRTLAWNHAYRSVREEPVPVQIQTIVTKYREVITCSHCDYRKEGFEREERREVK